MTSKSRGFLFWPTRYFGLHVWVLSGSSPVSQNPQQCGFLFETTRYIAIAVLTPLIVCRRCLLAPAIFILLTRYDVKDKKTTAKTLRRKLLHKFSLAVRERDKSCVICGQTNRLQAHHILEKKYYPEFRTDEMNGITLCAKHHLFCRCAAHTNAVWFSLWLQTNRPEQFELEKKNFIEPTR